VRKGVSVHPLGTLAPLAIDITPTVESAIVPAAPPPLPTEGKLAPAVAAATYVWCDPDDRLYPELWSFEQFVRDNAWKWVGEGARDNADYKAVEEVRWTKRTDS
jgi:hypothetical protein